MDENTHTHASTSAHTGTKLKLADAKDFMKNGEVYKPKRFFTSKPYSSTPTNVNVLPII